MKELYQHVGDIDKVLQEKLPEDYTGIEISTRSKFGWPEINTTTHPVNNSDEWHQHDFYFSYEGK